MHNEDASGPLRILLIEDSAADAELIEAMLARRSAPYSLERIETTEQMASALDSGTWDIVLSDYNLPRFSALEALAALKQSSKLQPMIVVSGFVGEEAAVSLIKAGAFDFVAKENLARLNDSIDRCLREMRTRQLYVAAVQALADSETHFKTLVANLPGVVFQCELSPSGPTRWIYLSARCESLLGFSPQALEADPQRLAERMQPEDRERFLKACEAAMLDGGGILNWEGRLNVTGTAGPEWLEIRASVSAGAAGKLVAEGIIDDITRNKRFEGELLKSREQLRELSEHLDEAKEQERASIAREIHDELGGLLTAAKIELVTLAGQLPPDRLDWVSATGSCEALIDQAMDMSRRIARRLRPAILDFGIVAAIEWQARDFSRRFGVPCDFTSDTDDIDLEPQRATTVFRVFQETLTNIAKHSHARHVHVELETAAESRIALRVSDDGRGFTTEEASKPGSFGIRNMRERAQSLGGELRVNSAPGSGTEIWLEIPGSPDGDAQPAAVQLELEG